MSSNIPQRDVAAPASAPPPSKSPSVPPAALQRLQDPSAFSTLTELSSAALGTRIEAVSDQWFAEAANLLKTGPPVAYPGVFVKTGSLMDGWESRRHCETHDWVIIRLGAVGRIEGVDIDTGHFDGNEAPEAELWGAAPSPGTRLAPDSPLWQPILPRTSLGPAQRHIFKLPSATAAFSHLKLTMHPDGGIGRLRCWGTVIPRPPPDLDSAVDLASALEGGRVVATSDAHYGAGSYLLLPGRGKDMEDGWHTKRSRGRLGTDKGDWLVVKLGGAGHLEWADVDTKDFIGNFPREASLEGIVSAELEPPVASADWREILPRQRLTADSQHVLPLAHSDVPFTHVRLNIYPDGGLKRLRLYGRRAEQVGERFAELKPLPQPQVEEQWTGVSGLIRSWFV